jgi:hypothetical protein
LRWQSSRFENDAKKSQTNTTACTGSQSAGSCVSASMTLGLGTSSYQVNPNCFIFLGLAIFLLRRGSFFLRFFLLVFFLKAVVW